eukprot:1145643-Pelagomonas_calceolata.AAC.7
MAGPGLEELAPDPYDAFFALTKSFRTIHAFLRYSFMMSHTMVTPSGSMGKGQRSSPWLTYPFLGKKWPSTAF